MTFYYIIASTVIAVATALPSGSPCPNGWVHYEDSCIYTERTMKLPFRSAEARCRTMGAELYTPNSLSEYRRLINDAPLNDWTWTGIYKEHEDSEVQFSSKDHIDMHDLDWLIKPYTNSGNGWTSLAQCGGHYNPSSEIGKYAYWYPCTYSMYYICEKKAVFRRH